MSITSIVQLNLFDNNSAEPHPLIVAHKYGFPLAYIDRDGNPDNYIYPCNEWYEGVSESSNGWRKLKGELVTSGNELELTLAPYVASNGKTYQTDYTNAHGLYIITQHIRSQKKHPRIDEVKQYLAAAGVWIDKARRNPQAAGEALLSVAERRRLSEIEKYERAGFGDAPQVRHLRARHEGIDAVKELKDIIYQICEKPNYPQFFNAEYMALFGQLASGLKQILGSDSIRDALPERQLAYLRVAELNMQELMRQSGNMTMEQILAVVERIVKPLGENLREVSDMLGVNHITGQALLEAKG